MPGLRCHLTGPPRSDQARPVADLVQHAPHDGLRRLVQTISTFRPAMRVHAPERVRGGGRPRGPLPVAAAALRPPARGVHWGHVSCHPVRGWASRLASHRRCEQSRPRCPCRSGHVVPPPAGVASRSPGLVRPRSSALVAPLRAAGERYHPGRDHPLAVHVHHGGRRVPPCAERRLRPSRCPSCRDQLLARPLEPSGGGEHLLNVPPSSSRLPNRSRRCVPAGTAQRRYLLYVLMPPFQ